MTQECGGIWSLSENTTCAAISVTDAMVQCLYADYNKDIRDLFYNNYQTGFNLMYNGNPGLRFAIPYPGQKVRNSFSAGVSTSIKKGIITTDLKSDPKQRFCGSMLFELEPGVKALFDLMHPHRGLDKMELQYQTDCAGISSSIGLAGNPVVEFSCMLQQDSAFSFGIDVGFNTAVKNVTKCNCGLRIYTPNLMIFLNMNALHGRGTASLHQVLESSTYTALGCEFSNNFFSKKSSMTLGMQRALDNSTMFKVCVDNFGRMRAALQHEWWPKASLTISGEVDGRAIMKTAKVGLSVAIDPDSR